MSNEQPTIRPARLRFDGRSYALDPDERQAFRGVEVVPAEQLQGAVEALRELEADLQRPGMVGSAWVRGRLAPILQRLGGQCPQCLDSSDVTFCGRCGRGALEMERTINVDLRKQLQGAAKRAEKAEAEVERLRQWIKIDGERQNSARVVAHELERSERDFPTRAVR
jgi:hypothetical protein